MDTEVPYNFVYKSIMFKIMSSDHRALALNIIGTLNVYFFFFWNLINNLYPNLTARDEWIQTIRSNA